jgi:hypothetical protein
MQKCPQAMSGLKDKASISPRSQLRRRTRRHCNEMITGLGLAGFYPIELSRRQDGLLSKFEVHHDTNPNGAVLNRPSPDISRGNR